MTAIDAVQVVITDAAPGDDDSFVALHGAKATGWYGPVSGEIGRQVEQLFAHVVIGEPAMDHDRLHTVMRQAISDDSTWVTSWALGAVDCAAWDLHGQLVQASVADLLADSSEPKVPLYGSWLGLEVAPSIAMAINQAGRGGWQFTKWGLRRDSANNARDEAGRLTALTQTVASALGSAAAFDALFTWDAALAGQVADLIDPANVLWLEDPLPSFDPDAYRSLTAKTPLALGERLLVHDDAQALLEVRPKVLTLDVVACGGITRAVDLVVAAGAQGIAVYPHGRSFVPALHLAAAYPDTIPAVEYRLQWEPARQQQYLQPQQPAKGVITVPRSPGLGATPRSH